MVKEVEGQFEVDDGASLYTKTWLPDDSTPTVAKLVFIHGFSDHLGRYYDLFPTLARAGIAVYGFDQRGWGRSVRRAGDRGATGPTDRVLADMAAFITAVAQQQPARPAAAAAPPPPLFVMGHSMGGGEALTLASDARYAARVAARVRGWLLEAPFVDFDARERPSWLKVAAGRLAGRLLPRLQLANPIPPEYLSRDAAVVRAVRADALCHDTGTLEGLAGLLDRTGRLARGEALPAPGVVRSVWFGHGDADRATGYAASRAYYERLARVVEDCEFKTYEGWLHQLHAEVGREEFYADVRDWILRRVGDDDAPGKTESKL